jgi:hypothetical protein
MRRALSVSAAALVMLVSARASANFHAMKIVEVFAGSAAAPDAHYIQLQMYAAGQNFVGGHFVHVYDAAGVEIAGSLFTFSGNVANSADQANILIGTAAVTTAFGIAPDFTLPAKLNPAGGAVCFEALDCFAWGNFTPGMAADGAVVPFNALTADKAARRSIASGDPALLELADDSNNVFDDFKPVDPAPKNNNNMTSDGGITADAGKDGSAPPADAGKDSGITTQPSPNNPVVTADSGTTTDPGGGGGGDSGCSVAMQPSDGWATILGLFAAASLFVTARRRRRSAR